MPRLLVVHHTPSPALQEMFEAAVRGARTDEIDDVEVIIRPALTAAAVDVLEADGILLGTPANIGYMSGALKHFFDGIYYPCLEATRRRPYGLYVHGGMDTTGAVRAVESIATGLQWRAVRPPVTVTGQAGPGGLLGTRRPARRRNRGLAKPPAGAGGGELAGRPGPPILPQAGIL
jgi:NAD(P)H-dependent FMN reductase